MIKGNKGESFVSRGYAPKISSIGTISLGPAESFIALTAVYSSASLFTAGSSFVNISYALRRGP